jgi:AbrB family looped-hinge helix DNA binding protein
MRTTIDRAGRIVIPKPLRDELGLVEGTEVEVSAWEGRLEVEVPPTTMHLERRGGVTVAVPDRDLPTLTAAQVRNALEGARR